MNTRAVSVEWITFLSSKPIAAVARALEALVGQPDMAAFRSEMTAAQTEADLERVVERATGAAGLLLFMRFDLGEVLRKEQARARVCATWSEIR